MDNGRDLFGEALLALYPWQHESLRRLFEAAGGRRVEVLHKPRNPLLPPGHRIDNDTLLALEREAEVTYG